VLPVQNAHDIFNLKLTEFGPYSIDITKNGKHLLLAGRKGHLAMVDWKTKGLVCEFQAKDKVRDVCFLQNHTMFAVAQSKYLHIYDNQGIELHCMRDHAEPAKLDYLPYHFLLASASRLGTLRYLDVSMG
jgi:U3 small nucleolar RNA-associated protein 7